MQQVPIIMEIGVLGSDWDETVDFYSQVLNQPPVYIDASKVLFRTADYDLYLIKLALGGGGLIGVKFPPTYYNVGDASAVSTIYKQVLMKIPGAAPVQKPAGVLVFPVPDAKTADKKVIVVTMASVVIKPKSTCKAQVDMVLGVIHNPPY